MSQVRKLNENSSRRYQFYDRRIKNLLRKIHTDSREKPDKNSSEVSLCDPGCTNMMGCWRSEILSVTLSFHLAAGADGEDPSRGCSQRHHGVPARSQLQSLGPAGPVSPAQLGTRKGKIAKVRCRPVAA